MWRFIESKIPGFIHNPGLIGNPHPIAGGGLGGAGFYFGGGGADV